MAVEFKRPTVPQPLRVVLLGAATEGWYQASAEERGARILPRLKAMFAAWQGMGARVLATVDDDLFMVGQPTGPGWSWYLVMDVPDLDVLAAMVDQVRLEVDGVRLDRCIRLEARVGRPFFLLESQNDG
jgi:hypothetical protein